MSNIIYSNIMRLLDEKKMTRAKLENAAGLGNGTIESWKDGNPTIAKLESVANVLGCRVSDLIESR